MSHYTKIDTQIVNKEALLKALTDLNFRSVEVHPSPVHLYGWQGDIRPEKADVVIRRHFIDPASNDIGFRFKPETGTYEAIISEYDQGILGADWVNKVCKLYAYHGVVEKLQEQGFVVEKQEGDLRSSKEKVHLVLKRRS